MIVYRIVQDKTRTSDLSGTGSFKYGGRWNSQGTYMLYTSENSSLAFLETLVHFDKSLTPPNLFLMQLEVDDSAPVYVVPEADYAAEWKKVGLIENQKLGDRLMADRKYLAVKIKSAINELEYNFLLNPMFPGYHGLVKVESVREVETDARLLKS